MDGLTIFWTETAKKQRDHIFDYWNQRNKNTDYSKKLNLLIREKTKLLKNHPEMGKKTKFKAIRATSMGYYSILIKLNNQKL